jgi:hypothetical protein
LPQRIGLTARDRRRLPRREVAAIGGERTGAVTLRRQHVANLVVADRQVGLPLGVRGIARNQRSGHSSVGGERAGAVTLRHQRVADPPG